MLPTTRKRTIKFARLVAALARKPQDVPRYARYSIRARSPLELAMPWFSFAAIDFLEEFLHPDMTVHEYGGGGSTVFLGRRVRSVITVEHDPVWARQVSDDLGVHGITNVDVRLREADLSGPTGFAQSPFATEFIGARADIVVIDSYDGDSGHHLRPVLFERAQQEVNPGGIIVLDDSWRYTHLRKTHDAHRVAVFSGTGPARRTATSTDVYFY